MICNSVRDLYREYDSFLLDMYGVLYNGSSLYDGVLELLFEMKREGKTVVIFSNATIVSEIAIKRYERFNLYKGVHYDEFITSGSAFNKMLRNEFKNASYCQIFKPNHEIFAQTDLIEKNNINDVDFAYVGDIFIDGAQINLNNLVDFQNIPISIDDLFNVNWHNVQPLNQIQEVLDRCLKYNKKLFVANPDILAIEKINGEKSPILCQGAVGAYYESMGGSVVYFGKPHKPIYDYAKTFIKGKTVMVGDTPWTDILGGNMAGFDTILTLTGVFESFMQNMSEKLNHSDCIHSFLTTIFDRMTHKNLIKFDRIPTHIVKQFADRII